jgi:prepilin-type N-terminal cleavage/methylation domain-containing protein
VPLCLCGSKTKSPRAFTFFELLVVLVILSTALGMLAPNLRGFFFAHQTHEKALHLLALMRHARSQAVTQGITHRLTLNISDHEYILEQRVDGKYVELGNSLGQTFDWPDTMTLTFEADVEQNDPVYLYFNPQGTVTKKAMSCDRYPAANPTR